MLEIIWETAELALCVKPIGVRAQGEGETDLPALLSRQLGCSIYPVHRLDQAVGGVMVFAKTERMAAKLSKAIQEGKLQKEYLAVLTKRPEEDSGELHDLLFHDRFKNKTFVVSKERKGVKKAALSYRVLAESNGRCLVHVRLSTGRTHQIRVQFAASPALWSYALTLPGAGGKEERFCVQPEMQGAWEPFSDALSRLDTLI